MIATIAVIAEKKKFSDRSDLYSTANDPQNGPQMILDRKWSQKKYKNGLDSSLRIIVLILLLLLLQQVTLKAKFCLVTFSKLSLKQ